MLVEIRGIGIPNKGAELMLVAVMEKIRCHFPEAEFTLQADNHYIQRAKYGLYQTLWIEKLKSLNFTLFDFIPKKIRNKLGLKTYNEIDVIIDASGFRYSKQWGLYATKSFTGDYISRWKRDGKKVIFLPQAYGPFDVTFKEEIEKIVKYTDVLFARDEISKEHIENLLDQKVRIKQYPDFTNLLTAIKPNQNEFLDDFPKENRVAVIPNCRMLDKIDSKGSKSYPNILKGIIIYLKENGYNPFFLVHEGKGDFDIAKKVKDNLDFNISILSNDDPVKLKGIIGLCDFVVGSRFHGLISSLSQGIPVLAMGWSHKYNVLMNEYGISDFLFSPEISHDDLMSILNNFIEGSDEINKKVEAAAIKQKELTHKMWEEVIHELEK